MFIKRKSGVALSLFMLALFINFKANAQFGGSSVPFLLISPDARASGMGEVGTAIADDINAIYWNPGGLGFLDYFPNNGNQSNDEKIPYRQAALSYTPWLPQFQADLFYCYGTIGQYFPSMDGTAAFNFIFMNLGEFTRTADDGTQLGKFISNEFAVGLSYGTIVAPDLGVGFQLRYIHSNLTPTSVGLQQNSGTGVSFAFDLATIWKPQNLNLFGLNIGNAFSCGINLQNVGPKITYIKESDPLPTNLRIGVAYKLLEDEFNSLLASVDVSKLLVKRDKLGSDPLPKSLITGWQIPGAELAMGVEYWYEKVVALRAGYFTEPSNLGNRKYWNFGAGLRYDIFKLDFSFINTVEQNHPLANTMRFSTLIDWK